MSSSGVEWRMIEINSLLLEKPISFITHYHADGLNLLDVRFADQTRLSVFVREGERIADAKLRYYDDSDDKPATLEELLEAYSKVSP
jgi:hypothetical protein